MFGPAQGSVGLSVFPDTSRDTHSGGTQSDQRWEWTCLLLSAHGPLSPLRLELGVVTQGVNLPLPCRFETLGRFLKMLILNS